VIGKRAYPSRGQLYDTPSVTCLKLLGVVGEREEAHTQGVALAADLAPQVAKWARTDVRKTRARPMRARINRFWNECGRSGKSAGRTCKYGSSDGWCALALALGHPPTTPATLVSHVRSERQVNTIHAKGCAWCLCTAIGSDGHCGNMECADARLTSQMRRCWRVRGAVRFFSFCVVIDRTWSARRTLRIWRNNS
jgi:hypothetical protein